MRVNRSLHRVKKTFDGILSITDAFRWVSNLENVFEVTTFQIRKERKGTSDSYKEKIVVHARYY